MTAKFWMGDVAATDDFGSKIGKVFYDGKTQMGPWATMSQASWSQYGCGKVAQGYAQKYQKQADGKWMKVGG